MFFRKIVRVREQHVSSGFSRKSVQQKKKPNDSRVKIFFTSRKT